MTINTANLCVFDFCRLIGKLTVFFNLQEFISSNPTPCTINYRRTVFSSQIKSKVGHILPKTTDTDEVKSREVWECEQEVWECSCWHLKNYVNPAFSVFSWQLRVKNFYYKQQIQVFLWTDKWTFVYYNETQRIKGGLRGEEGRRCRCYKRQRTKVWGDWTSHTLGGAGEGGVQGRGKWRRCTWFVFLTFGFILMFIFKQNKTRRESRTGRCHTKTMMNTKDNKRLQ